MWYIEVEMSDFAHVVVALPTEHVVTLVVFIDVAEVRSVAQGGQPGRGHAVPVSGFGLGLGLGFEASEATVGQ